MKLRRFVVEGFRGVEALTWEPGDLTVLTGPRAEDVCASLRHMSNTARGWGAFGGGFDKEPPHPKERFTDGFAETRWYACLTPPEDGELDFGYELMLERIEENDGWAIVYERFTQQDDFDLKELLERQGSRAVFVPSPKGTVRAGAKPPKEEVARLADDMSALGAFPAFYGDKRIQPYTEHLAGWSWHRRIDPSTEGAPRRFEAERVQHDRLAEDGRNLVNALYSLWDFEALRAPVLAGLRVLDESVEALGFPADADAERMSVVLKHEGGRETGLAAMTDETVAWLLRGAMLCAVWPAPLLIVDAVDEGLPAGLAGPLAAMLRVAAGRTQVVLRGVSEGLDAALTEAFAGPGPTLVRSEV